MRISPVAYRYAKSLLDLALEQGKLNEVQADMALVAKTCDGSEDLRVVLKSPVVRPDQKQKVVSQTFGSKVDKVSASFLDVVVRKGRAAMVPQVAKAFEELYLAHEHILICKVTSAVPLTAEEREKASAIAQARFPGNTIRIQESVDPSIIGGGIIQVGDLQWDSSVKNKLHVIKRTLAENPYVAKI
ncbi:MAG: ATP synthase F1 subunit delta [Flavobacteriales bacterium]|nr:ATP synthase F1 subunit delta [Flavobacteriales bacterium]MCB0794627.1 ATP synthase F1 subunit delta [Flavobacteriales bacterium]